VEKLSCRDEAGEDPPEIMDIERERERERERKRKVQKVLLFGV
jgi:hypothetical protein